MTPMERRERVRWIQDHDVWLGPPGHNGHRLMRFEHCVSFEFVYINPETEEIDDDDSLNTQFEVWIEAGPFELYEGEWVHMHDIRLDCGAASMEDALLKLAELVQEHYNDDGTDKINNVKE